MIKLIKNAELYSPEYLGKKDILIAGNKIIEVSDRINFDIKEGATLEIIDASGKLVTPGFIDSHVHIMGGGGEGGFKTRTPEISLSDITSAGITTIVGCLGTDGISRDPLSLLAKARSLEEEGISTFIYTGSYRLPLRTITKDLMTDIIAIDKVIGAGEVAISDHRSSQPNSDELKRLAADARVAGMLSGKAGVVNVHLGDSDDMLNPIIQVLKDTDIPAKQFIPTHINRNQKLFAQGREYAKNGGYIDFTTSSDPSFWEGENAETRGSKALKICLDENVPIEKITFSSDGQGSLPLFNEKNELIGLCLGSVKSLYEEVIDAVVNHSVPFEKALMTITSNPASALKLKNKGRVSVGQDADLCIISKETFLIDTVIAMGRTMVEAQEIIVYGTFENKK